MKIDFKLQIDSDSEISPSSRVFRHHLVEAVRWLAADLDQCSITHTNLIEDSVVMAEINSADEAYVIVRHGQTAHYSSRPNRGNEKAGDVVDRPIDDDKVHELETEVTNLKQQLRATREMVSCYLVAAKGHVSDSWLNSFVEVKAVTINHDYPSGFIKPVPVE